MQKHIWPRRMFWLLLPVLLLLAAIVFRPLIFYIVEQYFPTCAFYVTTHLYCPGCGNTRAILSLLQGKPLLALRNNAALCYLLMVILLFYVQKLLESFGKTVRLLPKGNWFPVVSVIVCMAYCVIRNFFPILQPIG